MCGLLLFELKERILGYQGQTSTLGTGRRQGYQVVQSLARLALEGWSHRVLGCDGPVGKEWSAQLGETMPETTRECKRWDAGSLSCCSARKRG